MWILRSKEPTRGLTSYVEGGRSILNVKILVRKLMQKKKKNFISYLFIYRHLLKPTTKVSRGWPPQRFSCIYVFVVLLISLIFPRETLTFKLLFNCVEKCSVIVFSEYCLDYLDILNLLGIAFCRKVNWIYGQKPKSS